MSIDSPTALFFDQLRDLLSVESQLVPAMPELIRNLQGDHEPDADLLLPNAWDMEIGMELPEDLAKSWEVVADTGERPDSRGTGFRSGPCDAQLAAAVESDRERHGITQTRSCNMPVPDFTIS